MTINLMDLIVLEDFLEQVLEEPVSAYVCHVFMIKSCFFYIRLSPMALISTIITETVTLSETYNGFEDFFLAENARYLPFHEDHYHAIDDVDGKQHLY